MLRQQTSADSQDNFAKALLKDIVAAGGKQDWIQIQNNRSILVPSTIFFGCINISGQQRFANNTSTKICSFNDTRLKKYHKKT